MSKVLFLDMDGVVCLMPNVAELSSICLKNLKKIIDETNAYIVVSSDWRKQDSLYDYLCRELKSAGIGEPVGRTPVIKLVDVPKKECEKRFGENPEWRGVTRTLEIEKWLEDAAGVDKYAVVDDDYLYLRDSFFHINPNMGLDHNEVEKIISYLNN